MNQTISGRCSELPHSRNIPISKEIKAMSEAGSQSGITDMSRAQQGPNAVPVTTCPPVVTNGQQLVIPPTLSVQLHEQHLHALNIVQLEYARDVSAAAASAYEKLIAEFRRTDAPPRSAD
jgi:hypothetical protein